MFSPTATTTLATTVIVVDLLLKLVTGWRLEAAADLLGNHWLSAVIQLKTCHHLVAPVLLHQLSIPAVALGVSRWGAHRHRTRSRSSQVARHTAWSFAWAEGRLLGCPCPSTMASCSSMVRIHTSMSWGTAERHKATAYMVCTVRQSLYILGLWAGRHARLFSSQLKEAAKGQASSTP